jgi:endonuclease G
MATAGAGYDPEFLPVSAPFPVPAAAAPTRELPFTHFSVLLHLARRLAVATAVNLDGAALRDLERGDDWHLDPRLPADQQTGPDVYVNNDLDRGHLVRRRDPVWGDPEIAAQANFDTFSYVNAAPQAAEFNQGKLLWAGLEDYILDHARTYRQRLSVFTAPILAEEDPPYRGVQIPRRFWKIAAWAQPGTTGQSDTAADPTSQLLAATGYLLDQTPQLDDVELATQQALDAGDPPPLGPYRTFQVPIIDIATLTGLSLGPLPAADRLPTPTPVPVGELATEAATTAGRWMPLHEFADIQL